MENIKKYGIKEHDIISKQFDISFKSGITFCLGNVQKYLTRFNSVSVKGNNIKDIYKVYDYLERVNEKISDNEHYLLLENIIEFLKIAEYKHANNLAFELQKELINNN